MLKNMVIEIMNMEHRMSNNEENVLAVLSSVFSVRCTLNWLGQALFEICLDFLLTSPPSGLPAVRDLGSFHKTQMGTIHYK